ncbi:MAG: hypothetical protein PSX80_15015 [bacterium]|nr:hypothetical protein [bacterium]
MQISFQSIGILISALAVLVGACNQNREIRYSADNRAEATMSPEQSKEDPYLDIRSMALSMPAGQFEIDASSEFEPYGVVLDWNVGKGAATFTAFKSGDASMYASTGGGIIGGVGHDNVKIAAQSLVRRSKIFIKNAKKTDDISVARDGTVKFFFLTTNGRFVSEETLDNLDNGSSPWLELFIEANKLITELRALGELN